MENQSTMKLTLSKDHILEGLQKVQSIVNPRTTLPILSNVLLKADKGQLTLTTTDLEISVRTRIEAKVDKAGGSTLPARRLFSIFRELPDHEIELNVDEKDNASIRCGASFFKLVGMSEDDFPPLPKFDGDRSYSLEQGAFKEMLRKTAYAASTDETRYVLNGVYLSFKDDKLLVVATDGRRLALVEHELEFPKEAEADIILPSKTVHELLRSLNDEGSLKIKTTGTQVAFDFENHLIIISKLIEGSYPNYKQVIPAQSEKRIAVEREALLAAVKRAALVTTEQSNSVKLIFGKNQLQIITSAPDIGEAKETLAIKYSGKEISIAFNPEFIMDPLKTLDSDEIFVELSDELSPGVFKSNVPFIYVIMPMRMN